jgi:hypothetical protein
MKTRLGFVSNSSSSSFVCNVNMYEGRKKVTLDEVIKKTHQIFDFVKAMGIIDSNAKFEDIFQEPRIADKEAIRYLNEGWNSKIGYKKDLILVNSADDNSIPYEIFDLISDVFNAKRVHLG